MFCQQCGHKNEANTSFCVNCGAALTSAPAPVAQPKTPVYAAPAAPVQPASVPVAQPAPAVAYAAPSPAPVPPTPTRPAPMGYTPTNPYAPALQLPTNRGLAKFFFLSLITFGIYGIVVYSRLAGEINIVASRADGQRTVPFFGMMYLVPFTLGIYMWVWYHKLSERIGSELYRRGITYKFSASDYWLWNILGSLIIVGPFIYCHKLLKAMNLINSHYNMYG